MTNDHFVTVVSQVQASLECPHYLHRQWRWDILLHNSESNDNRCIQPNQLAHTQHRLVSSCLRFHLRILASPGSTRLGDHFPRAMYTNCQVAVSRRVPSWAPVSHRTSPGSRATNVQEAPRKKGLRSVGPATVMNPFEFSSGLTARRSCLRRCVVLDSLRDTREPSVQVCDILHTSCAVSAVKCSSASCAAPDLCHLHLVRGRRNLGTSAQH